MSSAEGTVGLQVNATGVMPVIFSSSLLALPTALSRYFPQVPLVDTLARIVTPGGLLYLPVRPQHLSRPALSSLLGAVHGARVPLAASPFSARGADATVLGGGQVNVLLIAFFNYYYTFLQLDPKDLAEQLKRQVRLLPLTHIVFLPQRNTCCQWTWPCFCRGAC